MTKPNLAVLLLVGGFGSGAHGAPPAETTTRHRVSLKAGDAVFSAVVLTNTHARTYTDSSRPGTTPNRCDLEDKTTGVIWKVLLEGAAISAKEITVSDDAGLAFRQVCWSSSGGVYKLDANGKRIGGGPQTEFLAAGPDGSRQVTVKLGETSAVISLAK